jgi:anti-sigma factor RsiW
MDCKNVERLLLRSFDEKLGNGELEALHKHLAGCPSCRTKDGEYRLIRETFRESAVPAPRPYFKERVLAKLKEREQLSPGRLWLKWAHRAAAFSLAAFILFGAGVLLFRPQEPQELSQVETLFLRDENPLSDAANVLDQKKAEDKNMMLIFASADLPRR